MRSRVTIALKFENLPLGLTKSLIDELILCGEIASCTLITSCQVYYNIQSLYKLTDERLNGVFIDFRIEESLAESFKKYVQFYVDTMLDKHILLENCWRIEE